MGSGYVVVVTFAVKPEFKEEFRDAIIENADLSRSREPGCSIFDVSENNDGSEIFLYEVYDDEASFKEHLTSEHFRRFDTLVKSWISDKRIATYRRLA